MKIGTKTLANLFVSFGRAASPVPNLNAML